MKANAPGSDGLNNRFSSYQQGSSSYTPPSGGMGGGGGMAYADSQTNVLQNASRAHWEAENRANAVLSTLHGQRQQLQGAGDDVWQLRQATEQTRRELESLRDKYRAKKRRLYGIIAIMAGIDLLLFARIIQCHGSFFCWRRY